MMPNQRDIYLAPFPFSDEDAEKQRPVLVISNSVFNTREDDVIVMAITSNLDTQLAGIHIDNRHAEQGTIPAPSLILPNKVYSVAKDRIGRFFCRLSQAPFDAALAVLKETLGLT